METLALNTELVDLKKSLDCQRGHNRRKKINTEYTTKS